MPTGNHFFSKQLGNYLRDMLNTNLASELSLKTCHFGDLDPFPTNPDDITNRVPAIFIQPESVDNDFAAINERYHNYYSFRIIYVNYFPDTSETEYARGKIERIGDVITEDLRLNGTASPTGVLTLGSPVRGQVVWSIVRNVQYRPPEDNFLVSINANLFAAALTWQVRVLMFRNP